MIGPLGRESHFKTHRQEIRCRSICWMNATPFIPPSLPPTKVTMKTIWITQPPERATVKLNGKKRRQNLPENDSTNYLNIRQINKQINWAEPAEWNQRPAHFFFFSSQGNLSTWWWWWWPLAAGNDPALNEASRSSAFDGRSSTVSTFRVNQLVQTRKMAWWTLTSACH